jgi:hypothetical protein
MLSDLGTLDVSARGLFDASPGFIPPNAFRSLALITEALECFSPQTVSALVDVTDRLDALRTYLERLANRAFARSPTTDATIRALVVVLLDRIVILKVALGMEGGIYHPFVRPLIPDGLGPGSTSLPPLPPSPFLDAPVPKAGAGGIARLVPPSACRPGKRARRSVLQLHPRPAGWSRFAWILRWGSLYSPLEREGSR